MSLDNDLFCQGEPVVTLNGIKNRCTKWQCVTIPSNCPHQGHNDTQEEVVILWNYLSLTDKVKSSTIDIYTTFHTSGQSQRKLQLGLAVEYTVEIKLSLI